MRASFQIGMPGLSGNAGELTFVRNYRSGRIYARKRRYPRLSEHHHKTGQIAKNLFRLEPSVTFIQDLRAYLLLMQKSRRLKERSVHSWTNIYYKMMFEMARRMPELDLGTLTRAEIYERDLPCISVRRAVEALLLPNYAGYESLTAEM